MTEASAAAPEAQAQKQRSALLLDWRVHFWAIVAIAFIPRAVYLAQIYHWPFFFYPILDSRTQNAWAEILLKSLGIGNNEVTAKPPLYMYFLALTKVLVGAGDFSLFAARLLQFAMGSFTCGLSYLVGRRVFGLGVGVLGGLFLVFYSPGIFNEGELLDTALATFLATALLLALLGSLDKPTAPRWFGVGLLLGALGLTRGNFLLLTPLVLVLLFIWLRTSSERGELVRFAWLFLLGLAVVILPITARNAVITGTLLPISSNGGINFYTGNNPDADGYTPILSGVSWERTWYLKAGGVGPTGLPRTIGSLTSAEQDRYWMRRGISFWLHQPGRALALLVKKACLYWTAYDIPNNVSYAWARSHVSLLRAMPFTFVIIGPLGLLGIALGGWRSRHSWLLTLFVAVQWLAVTVFFVNGRYRMPAVPVLCLFGAHALIEMVQRGRARQWNALGVGLVGLVIFAAFVNADLYGVGRAHGANRDSFFLGQSWVQMGNLVEARQAFAQATKDDPKDADAWFFLGNMADQLGDSKAAGEAFRRALAVAPDFATAASRLGDVAIKEGWPLKEPTQLLRRALDSQPSNLQGLTVLVRLEIRLGEKVAAEKTLRVTAEAFSRWSQADSRYASAQVWVQQAASEAQAVDIPLPDILRGQQGTGSLPLQ